jgi:light-regulated signal transduction histidine kinase (bacteriophytochrome)
MAGVSVFFVVWFLASYLTGLVQQREKELASANRRLTIAQRDKTRHMLRTTHELKAPFAAIAANAQLLLGIAHYSQKDLSAARPYFERARQSAQHRQIADSYLQAIRAAG